MTTFIGTLESLAKGIRGSTERIVEGAMQQLKTAQAHTT
jgi:hypothetical protein